MPAFNRMYGTVEAGTDMAGADDGAVAPEAVEVKNRDDPTPPRGGGSSPLQASANFIKCCIGAGSFSLPFAFYNGGVVGSSVATLLVGLLAAYTIGLLGWLERIAEERLAASGAAPGADAVPEKLTYAKIGKVLCPACDIRRRLAPGGTGFSRIGGEGTASPSALRASQAAQEVSWNGMELAINVSVVATSIGVGAAYLDFISSTLQSLVGWQPLPATLVVLPFILLLSLVSSYKHLAWTSILGNIAVAAGIIAVVAVGAAGDGVDRHGSALQQVGVNGTSREAWQDVPAVRPLGIVQVVGSVAFLFAVHIVVLPVVQSMRDRGQFNRVVYWSMGGVAVTNAAFGAVCALLFTSAVAPNIIDNLGDSVAAVIVKVLLCVDLLFTIPMVLAAGRQILEGAAVAQYRLGKQLKAELHRIDCDVRQVPADADVPPPAPRATSDEPLRPQAGAHLGSRLSEPPQKSARDGRAFCGWVKCGTELALRLLVRFSMVLAMLLAAVFIPDFAAMVTLVGGLINSFTGFLFPAVLYLAASKGLPQTTPLAWWSHVAIAVFGVVAAALTTTFTIMDIVNGA